MSLKSRGLDHRIRRARPGHSATSLVVLINKLIFYLFVKNRCFSFTPIELGGQNYMNSGKTQISKIKK